MNRQLFIILFLFTIPVVSVSQIPRTISYQGVLIDNAGNLKPDGLYDFTFRLYDVSGGGTPLWVQAEQLQVTRGLFVTLLGASAPFNNALDFTKQYWLGIQVGIETELSPRIKLSSSAYSMNSIRSDSARIAGTVADNSITSSKIANGTIQFSDIGQNGAATGQVIKWNGTAWSSTNDSAGSGGGNYWVQSGNKIFYISGNVGVNNPNPATLFDIGGGNNWDLANSEGDFRIGNSSYRLKMGVALGGGGAGASTIMQYGQTSGFNALNLGSQGKNLISLYGNNSIVDLADIVNGKVGIGTSTPNAPLGFPLSLGKKITLYPGASGDAGFGVGVNRLQIYSDNPNADVALGYDAAGVFNERFAVKPNGALAVNGNTGATGQVLQSNGSANAAAWVSSTDALYNNIFEYDQTSNVTTTNYQVIPGLQQTLNLSANAKVIISTTGTISADNCFACGSLDCSIGFSIDNYLPITMVSQSKIANGEYISISTGMKIYNLNAGAHTFYASIVHNNSDLRQITGSNFRMCVIVVPQ
jgi:hypothetical protein